MQKDKQPIPVLCFVGTSNSGKTTLITKVISMLAQRGYNVSTVKHTHKEFAMDSEGKDSYKHKTAGAKTVVLASPLQFAVMSDTDHELTIEEVAERFIYKDTNILIVEGFKKDKYPKIEVYRKGISGDLRCINDPSIIALASDDSPNVGIPVFDINDAEVITDFIEKTFLP
ncbi:MAG: molybdopterin-guanine dinucleotide biosynthesis protein B [Nitrospirae bacterium]|nr:molybdopterin-guanine dinucleotide biosynthesis protein B [Nitrospirota bacterium]